MEHQPHPYAELTCAHVAQLEEKALQGSEVGVGVTAHVLLLGHTHPAEAEHVVDAVALDCWHAAKEDVDEVLPEEQYSEGTHEENTAERKKEGEDDRLSARPELTRPRDAELICARAHSQLCD